LREEFLGRRTRATIVESFGTLDWDDAYDHKADRRRDVVNLWSEPPTRWCEGAERPSRC